MKFDIFSSVVLWATAVQALENTLGVNYGINPDSMISYDKIYFGYAPNWNPSVSMSQLNGDTGQKGATYNVYSQLNSDNVNSGTYDGNDQWPTSDIISSGAVLIASLQPEVSSWSDITPGLCSSIASFFEDTFTSKGVVVWLRFAHEMNFYADPNGGQFVYPALDNGDFKTAWSNMYNAIKGNDNIYMYWSPNFDSSSEPAAPWWPGPSEVDMVGMDYYPNADEGLPTFASAYGSFYNTYAKANNLPFAIGETGTQLSGGTSASVAQREAWLKAVIDPSGGFSDYPLYMSCTWFEYGPPANGITFYVVYDQSVDTVKETISNTENGSAS